MFIGGKDKVAKVLRYSIKTAIRPGAACLPPATHTAFWGVLPYLVYRAAKKMSPTRGK